ncbi:VQ motif-containing protein 17-like [Nicotiana tabacum]|uniref:VQ motif-containing protein 17-like n=1 Tax=Nicotiana tabacum TaxID=4097 RepID=A0AC58TFB4_TOBAC
MKQITSETISPSCSKHSMHKDSHTITKLKPKIRIIHIVAPEIIKTDVENFRELVQRLTGKNAAQVKEKKTKKDRNQRKNIELSPQNHHYHQHHQHMNMLQDINYRMKEEESEGISYGSAENSSNGFLSGFGMEGFIQDLSEFPLFPFKLSTPINMFGEVPLC